MVRDAAFPAWIILKKKIEAKYLLFALPSLWTINLATQSCFTRDPQLRVHVISVSSELYFVASGSVLSRMIYSVWFTCFH